MSRTQVYEWFKRSKDGCETLESDERSGRPLTSNTGRNVELVCAVMQGNCRIVVRELADDLNISFRSVQ